jgi:hypothetical protein
LSRYSTPAVSQGHVSPILAIRFEKTWLFLQANSSNIKHAGWQSLVSLPTRAGRIIPQTRGRPLSYHRNHSIIRLEARFKSQVLDKCRDYKIGQVPIKLIQANDIFN